MLTVFLFLSYYQKESFNVKPRYECIQTKDGVRIPSQYNNEVECLGNSGRWLPLYSYLEKTTSKNEFLSRNKIKFIFKFIGFFKVLHKLVVNKLQQVNINTNGQVSVIDYYRKIN